MAISPQEAARALLARRQARESLEGWCREALRPLEMEPAAHHQLLIKELDGVITGATRRLLVTMPPGSAKSTYGTVLTPPYFLERMPGALLIGASHTADLAESFSRKVMQTIRDNQRVLSYSLASEAAAGWRTTNGGEYKAAGVGGPITGKRADLAIIDDPVKSQEDADSQTVRDKVWGWYWSDLRTRLKPGARVVLIMTRWHEDDIAGRLLGAGGDDWKVLHIRAEAEDDDPLGRAPGEFLWGDTSGYDYAGELRQMKGELESSGRMQVWHALYQGSPRAPDGNIFKVANVATLDAEPAGYKWVRAWDLAATRRGGDWTVGLKLGRGQDGRLCIGDVVRLQGSPEEVERAITNTAARDGKSVMIGLPQDPGQAGKAQIAYFTRLLLGYAVDATPETGDKATRAGPIASQVNAGNVSMVRGHWNRGMIDEMGGFPSAKFDDQVDALSRASTMLIKPPASARTIKFNLMGR